MKTVITIIRTAIGWHFLYEGCIKLFAEKWTAASYLNNTFGFLSGFYHWLAASPTRLAAVDFLNIWGLILIGLALFIGACTKWASLVGALLLTMYYFAYPPFGITLLGGNDTAFIINQLFIESVILIVFFFCKEKGYGWDNAVQFLKRKKHTSPLNPATVPANIDTHVNTRRQLLKDLAVLPVLGIFGWGASRSSKIYGIDTLSGATIQINQVALNKLTGKLPKGKLGNHEITRLVMGGNLIAGFSHARDLIYADKLFKAYNTEKKIFETLILCEQAGINCINSSFSTINAMAKYKKITGSKIKVIAQVKIIETSQDIFEGVKKAIDSGMDILQLQGVQCDLFCRDKKTELVGKTMDMIRSQGYVAGLGSHTIESFIICEENGIIPDYYMCTMHHDNYWSAHPRENRQVYETFKMSPDHNMYHDNIFCPFPDRTIKFINRAKVPVMGFKVLAAGAIHPKDGFNWAFENGADFVCAGMFDFQVVDDVNICIDTLHNLKNRERKWYA